MNNDRVEMFRRKLNDLSITDYHGLNSPGLTCYLNSVLQVLFMTEDFRESIKRCCGKSATTIDTLLGQLFNDLERRVAKTHSITNELGITDVYEQRDASEYFEKILCLASPEASKLFQGKLNHKTTCAVCKRWNDSCSFFWILPLAMGHSRSQTYSVERALRAFFKNEKVSGDDKMYCHHCNEKQDADIDCEMTKNPHVLTLLLKRFTFDDEWKSYVKLHCKVDVPQTLHMGSCKYDLYALVHHSGDLTGGHYTAEIKSFETQEWYCFNDDIVERVQQPLFGCGDTSVRSHTAYLLMYRKESNHSEKAVEIEQEGRFAQIDAEAEGEDDGPSGDETPKLSFGDDDAVWRRQTHSSVEMVKQTNRRTVWVRPHQDTLLQTASETDAGSSKPSSQFVKMQKDRGHHEAHCVGNMFEQNHNYQKKRLKPDDIAWEGTGTDSIVTTTRTKYVTDSSPKRNRITPAETKGVKNKRRVAAELSMEGSGVKQRAEHSHSRCRITGEPVSPGLCRRWCDLKRGEVKWQLAGVEGRTLGATQPVTEGVCKRKRKNTKRSEEAAKRDPWR